MVVVVLEVVVACGFAVAGLLVVVVLTILLAVVTRFCIVDFMTELEGPKVWCLQELENLSDEASWKDESR